MSALQVFGSVCGVGIALLILGAAWIAFEVRRAPMGEEIPGVGFVRTDAKPKQRAG
jgi:hypothetical protein